MTTSNVSLAKLLVVTYATADSAASVVTTGALVELLDRHDLAIGVSTSVMVEPEASSPAAQIDALAEITVSRSALSTAERRIAEMLDPTHESLLEVDERRVATYERNWELRTPSPGERLVSLLRRKQGLSREQFADYWRDVHAPVAMSFSILPSGYTQNVVIRAIAGKQTAPDGVMVMHFLNRDDRRARWADHPEQAARGWADGGQFMDTSDTTGAVMRETIWR